MRLIDAGKINYMWQIDSDGQEHDGVTLQSIIEKMPTIEAKLVETGEWIREPNCYYRCSNCKAHYPSIHKYIDYNYCPNCGAEMKGRNE